MPIEDVATLVTRWQRARSPAEQVRVVAGGARVLRSLSRDERRMLAQALGERGATDAAARLASYRGEQLTRGQLTDLASALSAVDRGQLEATAAALADPDERQRLLRAADGFGPVTVPPDPAPPPPPAPTGTPAALPPPDLPTVPTPAAPVAAAATADGGSDDPAAEDVDGGTGASVTEGHEGGAADEGGADDDGSDLRADDDGAAEVAEELAPGTPDIGDALAAIDDTSSVHARLTAVTSLVGRPLTSEQFTTLLRRLPDGWQRRTAARRLLQAGAIDDVDAGALLEVFGRGSDRLAVGQLLVAHGLAHVGTVADHLDRRSAERVRRRARHLV